MKITASNIENTDILEVTNTQNTSKYQIKQTDSTSLIEYKEIAEPCVALTIIGENRLTDVEVFFKRGFKFSFKALFSTLALTIINMFI